MNRPRPADALLTERIGLDPGSVGSSLITRGLEARKSALGLRDDHEYTQLLNGSGDEFQALVEEVVVPESWFFRDELPFRFLQDHVRTKWLLDTGRPPLRVLSLPCAGGEEPYSIAMSLLDAGLAPHRFRVDAVDLSGRALARARQGSYGRNSFRVADLGFRDRYFHYQERDGRYLLDARVRHTVRLIAGNLLDARLLADEPPYDVVFCRNLLIYFTDDARRAASANLLRLLAGSGVLFLGHAERLDLGATRLTAVGRGTFAFQRPDAPPAIPPPSLPAPAPTRIKALEPPHQTRIRTRPQPPPLPLPQLQPRPTAATPPTPTTAAGPAAGAELLDRAAEQADQGRYAEAVSLCEQAMREAGPSARAFFLLGMIRQAGGERDAAEEPFRKAVYLDPQHDEALLALALLAQRRGDSAAAAAYRRRAERAARKGVQ